MTLSGMSFLGLLLAAGVAALPNLLEALLRRVNPWPE
jgi:hypothetical protein